MMFAVTMIAKQSVQRYTPFFFFRALSPLEFYLIFITTLRNRASCSFNHIEGEFFFIIHFSNLYWFKTQQGGHKVLKRDLPSRAYSLLGGYANMQVTTNVE